MESYSIEHNFFAICTFSLLLLTTSLVFFQMAQSRKDLPFLFSSIFSIALVFISFIYTIIALYQYHERIARQMKQNPSSNVNTNEKVYWYFYLVLGVLFLLIEIFICFALLGKIEHWKLNVLKKIKK